MSNSRLNTVYSVNKIKSTGLADSYNMKLAESVILLFQVTLKVTRHQQGIC